MKTSSPLLTIKQILEVVLATKCTKESLSSFYVKELDVMGPSHWLVYPLFLAMQVHKQGSLIYERCGFYSLQQMLRI